MYRILYFVSFILICYTAINCRQPKRVSYSNVSESGKELLVGGGCDGCELMFVGIPSVMKPVDTSSGWKEKGEKIEISGTVYQIDGKTPAPNVIIYYWHTDSKGYYSPGKNMAEKAARHGHLRGWVRTGSNGHYSIYTIKPAPYPDRTEPAHIHLSVKEADISNEYYIDEFLFDDDKLLTREKRNARENRGGIGILKLEQKGNIKTATHDIILGLNIPDYPIKK